MKKNICTIDRVIRFVAGLAIMGLGAADNSWWGIIGLVLFFTAMISWCPIYSLLGLNFCKLPRTV